MNEESCFHCRLLETHRVARRFPIRFCPFGKEDGFLDVAQSLHMLRNPLVFPW